MRAARLIAVLGWATSLVTATAVADDVVPADGEKYFIRQDDPSTGTHIPRRLVTDTIVPINKRYADLTVEQQERLKSLYDPMKPGDEPPFPADGLQRLYAAMAQVQHKRLAQGKLEMHVDVDAKGDATSVKVFQSPDPELTRAVAGLLMLIKYKPGICDGRPCAMSYPLRMNFTVEH